MSKFDLISSTVEDVLFKNYYTKIFSISIGLLLSSQLYCKYKDFQQRQAILLMLDEKQRAVAQNKSTFRAKYPQVTPGQAEIVSLGYSELRAALQNGTLAALEVVEAYLAMAVEVDRETNAVTEFLEDAVDRARCLDLLEPGERGPMHGIPISAKEVIQIAGLDCTVGIPGNLRYSLCKADAGIITLLKELGAVPFCRTNCPQTCRSYECSNPIFGVTTNYNNKERSPGGSSGGEGALVCGGGSILGIGTDVGGSVLVPSMFSGIACLKPTAGRLPLSGQGADGGLPGIVGIHNTVGFMASSVDALECCMSQICTFDSLEVIKIDARLVPLPWNEDKAKQGQKLRIGWYDFDGVTQAAPGCRRAVKKARMLLEKGGHTLVEFRPPSLDHANGIYSLFCSADNGGKMVMESLKNSPIDRIAIGKLFGTWSKNQKTHIRLANWIWKNLGWAADLFSQASVELWELNAERLAVVEKILLAWEKMGLDVVITPGLAVPALKLGYAQALTPAITYTAVYNMLNFPAGSVTVCKETAEDQEALEKSYPGYEHSKTYGLMKEGSRGAVGMPLNVQVIGRPWCEEMVLKVMGDIEDQLS